MVPNFHFIQTRGFRDVLINIQSTRVPFELRKAKVFWAGSTTGEPCVGKHKNCRNVCEELDRVKLVRSAAHAPWLNVSLTSALQLCSGEQELLKNISLLSQRISEEEWTKYRGSLDIDGNVDAWGLYWRLKSGSVVFRVSSQYTNFMSARLVSGVHFVEISRSLDNIFNVTAMVKSHHTSPEYHVLLTISKNAEDLVSKITYEHVVAEFAGVLSRSQ